MTTDNPGPAADQALEPLFPQKKPDDQSTYAYRMLIGSLGLVLPVAIVIIAGRRMTPGLAQWKVLPSVSSYYYTGAIVVFVGLLVAMGLFLISYQGYKNTYGRRDRIASRIAGAAALCVAFFPTEAPIPALAPLWWLPATGTIHFCAAGALFCSFIYFSLCQFTRNNAAKGDPLPGDKRARNWIYIFCGIVMTVCIGWVVVAVYSAKHGQARIFLPEAIALEAFALSWLTKGRADRAAIGLVRRILYYGRNPGLFADKVWSVIRGEQ